jgi:two-component system sensor histidine kinase YesM
MEVRVIKVFGGGLAKLRPQTLRGQIITLFLLAVLLICAIFYYLYNREAIFVLKYNKLLENLFDVNRLSESVRINCNILRKYRETNSRNYIAQLIAVKDKMIIVTGEFQDNVNNRQVKKRITEVLLLTKKYNKLIGRLIFSEETERQSLIAESEKVLDQTAILVPQINQMQADEIRTEYQRFRRKKKSVELLAQVAVGATLILSTLCIILLLDKILQPVKVLTEAARNICEGKYAMVPIRKGSAGEESTVLTNAFNKMVNSINCAMRELNQKVEIERKLKIEEVKNARFSSALREAELIALQSQINPHFMFNTLNMIANTAYLENAEKSLRMVDLLAKILRYSLGGLNKVVTLEEEISNLDHYMMIQQTRFASRLKYYKRIEIELRMVRIPCLIIQPLVENAIIHGIEDKEAGGVVELHCFRERGMIWVCIKDDGVGIKPEILERLLADDGDSLRSANLTGLGINNVRERIELFFNGKGVFEIKSIAGKGTKIMLGFPEDAGDWGGGKICIN